jgi:hypothetical protein
MQIAKSSRPERVRAHSSKEGAEGGSARGVNPYQAVRSSAKTNKTEPGVLSPVFPTLQAVQGLSTSRGDVCAPHAEGGAGVAPPYARFVYRAPGM